MYRRNVKKPIEEAPTKLVRLFPTMAMTVKELEEELHISHPTAIELVHQAGFPSFNIGKRVLINREGLQRWLNEKCEATV